MRPQLADSVTVTSVSSQDDGLGEQSWSLTVTRSYARPHAVARGRDLPEDIRAGIRTWLDAAEAIDSRS